MLYTQVTTITTTRGLVKESSLRIYFQVTVATTVAKWNK